jgi:isopentenyl-diphosphate Delta-isomerase
MKEEVVLVDGDDREIGASEKMRAHVLGLRHRAISVFLFDAAGHMLIQQRSLAKYHSPGLWTNACCSHPRPGESPLSTATRRLGEELGATCSLTPIGRFAYDVDVGSNLRENEVAHLFTGTLAASVRPDPTEVAAVNWSAPSELMEELSRAPGRFTAWFRIYAAQDWFPHVG